MMLQIEYIYTLKSVSRVSRVLLIEIQLHDEDNIKDRLFQEIFVVKGIDPCAALFNCIESRLCCCKQRGIFKPL